MQHQQKILCRVDRRRASERNFVRGYVGRWCQAKLLICEIADFTPSAHAQSDVSGHAFRKRWLFTEISNILRTDD